MKTIRVIHVVYTFKTGGMEKGIATIVRHASERFEHVILCLHSSGETALLLPQGTLVKELYKPSGNSPRFLLKLARTLRSLKPAIVHARNWGGTDGIIAARLAGIRTTIQGEHGWEIDDPEGINSKRLKIRRVFDRWTQEYTCVSQHLEQWLYHTVKVKKPVTQIYNGVDTERYCPGDSDSKMKVRTELGIAPTTFVIGIIGRLDPIKDHPTLIQAVRDLSISCPDVKLLIVGEGPERPRLETLQDEHCLLLGNRLDVPAILQTLDVFVLPSFNEGISNTILEAMATGIPVIATEVGGNPELVSNGETGFLLPPRQPQQLAAILLRYARDPLLRQLHGSRGRTNAIQQFSIQQMTHKYEAVYQRVATSRLSNYKNRI